MLEALLKITLTKGIPTMWQHRGRIMLFLKTRFWSYRNKKIRFSISYLFRIQIPDTSKYLLVFNRRIDNQLQPPGGVYKRYGADHLFESWGYEPDNQTNGIGVDQTSSRDLRFRVYGKYVINVIKWFEEGLERETSAHREFIEELIDPEILDKEKFRKINYRQIGRHSKKLQYSTHHGCYEVMIYDIVELLPSAEQKEFLIALGQGEKFVPGKYAIVDGTDIAQLRLLENGQQIARIGEHTKYIINQK
ncbi:MAG: hypothetical protein ACO1O6_08645 [Bacteroidota bacterium]